MWKWCSLEEFRIHASVLCRSKRCSLEFRFHANVLCGNRWCSLEQDFKIHWSVLHGSDAVLKSSELMLMCYVEVSDAVLKSSEFMLLCYVEVSDAVLKSSEFMLLCYVLRLSSLRQWEQNETEKKWKYNNFSNLGVQNMPRIIQVNRSAAVMVLMT